MMGAGVKVWLIDRREANPCASPDHLEPPFLSLACPTCFPSLDSRQVTRDTGTRGWTPISLPFTPPDRLSGFFGPWQCRSFRPDPTSGRRSRRLTRSYTSPRKRGWQQKDQAWPIFWIKKVISSKEFLSQLPGTHIRRVDAMQPS